jgi:PEP-CTERM motif
MKTKLPVLAGILALCGMLTSGHAATVGWTASVISGDNDVIVPTGSQSVNAVSFVANNRNVSDPDVTVHGVLFTGESVAIDGSNASSSLSPSFTNAGLTYAFTGVNATNSFAPDISNSAFNALSSSYQTLLSSAVYGKAAGDSSLSLTISGLSAGTAYTIVFFTNQGGNGTQAATFTSGGSPITANIGSGDGAATAGILGNNFTATFTADATFQEFDFSAINHPAIDGIEVIAAVPEPSTVALLSAACGLVGLVAVRRFRLAAV